MKKKQVRTAPPAFPQESHLAEMFTVGWLLAVLLTAASQILGLVLLAVPAQGEWSTSLDLFGRVLSFGAVVTGISSLLLMGVVWRIRVTSPPRGIMVFSLLIGIWPILQGIWRHGI